MPCDLKYYLRKLIAKADELRKTRPGRYPAINSALDALRQAFEAEYDAPPRPSHRRNGRATTFHNLPRMWRQRATRLKKKYKDLLEKDRLNENARSYDGRLSEEWIGRIIGCAPHVSGRALAETIGFAEGHDKSIVSRWSIPRIRAAWVEMYTNMVGAATGACVENVIAATGAAGGEFVPVFVPHVQDEAEIRVLSGHTRDGPTIPRRQRASKVQCHVLEIVCGGRSFKIPTELEALGDKTAPTLATSLEALLRLKLKQALPQPQAKAAATGARSHQRNNRPMIYVVHIIIGDDCPTNLAAAKLLLAMVKERPLGPDVVYFVIVLKCGTHQAGLMAKEGVLGRAATSTGPVAKKAAKDVQCAAVRIYKYLLADYYENLVDSIHAWANAMVEELPVGISTVQRVQALRALYTERVVPDALVAHVEAVVAGGLRSHRRKEVVDGFIRLCVDLLRADDKPTLTRFFTYRVCIDGMHTMNILAMPQAAFAIIGIKMRTKNQTRLKKVREFFADPNADQAVRRSSLVLQITGGVEARMSKNPSEDEVPTAVAIVAMEVHAIVKRRLARILCELHRDPTLDHATATGVLLGVSAHAILRLDVLARYPMTICRLCRRWFPGDFLKSCCSFLSEDDHKLDAGFSLPFRDIALTHGSDVQCANWLASDPVQSFLEGMVVHMFAHSLSAERKANCVKHWLARKLSHLSSVSCNLMCADYHRWRLEQSRALEEAAHELAVARKAHSTNLRWKHEAGARPVGQPFVRGRVCWQNQRAASGADTGAAVTGARPPSQPPAPARRRRASLTAATGASPIPPATPQKRQKQGAGGSPATGGTSATGDDSASRPRTTPSPMVSSPATGLNDDESWEQEIRVGIEQAEAKLARVKAACGEYPATRLQLSQYIGEHVHEFRERLATAMGRRRPLSHRLFARPGIPAPARRIQPQAISAAEPTEWSTILGGRTGWHGAKTPNEKVMFYLVSFHGAPYFIDLEEWRQNPDDLVYVLGASYKLRVSPLSHLARHLTGAPVKVYFFEITSGPSACGVRIELSRGCELKEPLPKAARARVDKVDKVDSAEELGFSDESSDVKSSDVVAETTGEDTGAEFTSSSSGDDIKKPVKPTPGGKTASGGVAATGDPRATAATGARQTKKPLYDNTYFYIADNEGQMDVKILVHQCWTFAAPPMGMGRRHGKSKTLTPAHYGEDRANPVRSHFLLRAWMLWRARQDGFVAAEPGRKRLFEDEALRLERDVRSYQPQADGLLGDEKASPIFVEWVPDIAARLA